MNKLMITAAAALCATVGLSEGITSANIVGYEQQGVGKDEYSMLTPTFVSVGGAGLTLKDLKITSGNTTKLNAGNNIVYVFGNAGDPQLIADDATLEEFSPSAYAEFGDPEDEWGLEFTFVESASHWYLTADEDFKYPMDDYPISDGMGLYLNAARTLGKGLNMTFSGAVGTEDIEIPVGKDEYSMTGNASPVSVKLSDFTIASGNTTKLNAGNNIMYMFGTSGDPQLIADDATLEEFSPSAYAEFGDPEDEWGLEFTFVESSGHWYLTADEEFKYPMDNYPIDAGRGMYLNASRTLGKGLTFTIPPAVTVDK